MNCNAMGKQPLGADKISVRDTEMLMNEVGGGGVRIKTIEMADADEPVGAICAESVLAARTASTLTVPQKLLAVRCRVIDSVGFHCFLCPCVRLSRHYQYSTYS